MNRLLLPLLLLACALFGGCRRAGNAPAATPKPEAWPRLDLWEAEYAPANLGGVSFDLSNAARMVSVEDANGTLKADVVYSKVPQAALHLTLREFGGPQALREALANRHERMELNAGGNATELTELLSDGRWECLLASTPRASVTPVQFVAHRGSRMLWGVMSMEGTGAADFDSVAPLLRAFEKDCLQLLKTLKDE